jgi:molybdate transport system permease protein
VTGYFLLRVFGRRGPSARGSSSTSAFSFHFDGRARRWLRRSCRFRSWSARFNWASRTSIDASKNPAGTLGASPIWAFLTITLPLALPGLLAGLIIGFAKALGEFGATIAFVSNIPGETQTLALAIFTQLERPGGDAAAMRLAWLSVGISVLALIAFEALGRSFRRHRS